MTALLKSIRSGVKILRLRAILYTFTYAKYAAFIGGREIIDPELF